VCSEEKKNKPLKAFFAHKITSPFLKAHIKEIIWDGQL
jgi:hypothetical protein